MGNSSPTRVNTVYENVKKLEEIGVELKNKYGTSDMMLLSEEKEIIINLYRSFYYPSHSLRKLEEINEDHYHLRKILTENIKLYNKYNSTNVDVEDYIQTTVKNLQPTLRIIGV